MNIVRDTKLKTDPVWAANFKKRISDGLKKAKAEGRWNYNRKPKALVINEM